jgi:heterodisulfide reductase subunit B
MNCLKCTEAKKFSSVSNVEHANELRIEKMFNETYGIPILHYPQLLGLAMGMTPEELAFNELRVNASKILKKVTEGVNKQ